MSRLLLLAGRMSELAGGLQVRRVLPAARCRAVGPFVFFDHFGPVGLAPGADADVGPHPHIGLATLTYLFEGHFVHRDSLGTVQPIAPGAINWMSAGRGIVHSERVPDDERARARRLHGLQLWVALPPRLESGAPSFQHVASAELPGVELTEGAQLRVLVGAAFGVHSPVRTASPTLYLDLALPADAAVTLPALAAEMAVYGTEQDLLVDGEPVPARTMAVLPAAATVELRAGPAGARIVVIGGAAPERPVHMWWNFVSSDRARVADAARRWAAGGFDDVPGEPDRVRAPAWREAPSDTP